MTRPTLHLTDSATRRKAPFAPIDPENVRLYVCGPTVYDRAHLGNARGAIVFDLLQRLLRHLFGADRVTYVRNVTDVDDKINARAAETGRSIRDITEETLGWYREDMDALGVAPPDHEPRATEFVPEMVAMIETLVERGHAYAAEGHVLFDVRSYPGYGAFSGRSLDDMIAGARVEVAPYKRDPMDFVLWKPSEDGVPGWPSPWGRGRPGWHIECSAMSESLLGLPFDIHGGGADLQFPHHENEIAQTCCAHPGAGFANVWLHNGMLRVEGQKMSKSLGNFFTVRDLLDRGVPAGVIRLMLLRARYSESLDWRSDAVDEAKRTLARWLRAADGASMGSPLPVQNALVDDLNTALAIARLNELEHWGRSDDLAAGLELLGFGAERALGDGAWWRVRDDEIGGPDAQAGLSYVGRPDPDLVFAAEEIVLAYARARTERDFGTADRLRDAAGAAGLRLSAGAGRVGHGDLSDDADLDGLRSLIAAETEAFE